MKALMFTGISGFREGPFERSVRAAAQIGYDGLEIRALSHLPLESSLSQVKEMKALLNEYGITAPSIFLANGPYLKASETECDQYLERLERYVELASELGVSMISHKSGSSVPEKSSEADYDKIAYWMAKAADIFAEANIKLLLETHHNSILETIDSCLKLLHKIDHSNVGFALDYGNMAQGEQPMGEELVQRLGDKIWHVHCKDLSFYDKKPEHRAVREYKGRFNAISPMGEGDIDVMPIYRALMKQGYSGYFSMESLAVDFDGTPEKLAQHDYEMFKQQIKYVIKDLG